MGCIDDALTQHIGAKPVPSAREFRLQFTVHRCDGCRAILGISGPPGPHQRFIGTLAGGGEDAAKAELCPKCADRSLTLPEV